MAFYVSLRQLILDQKIWIHLSREAKQILNIQSPSTEALK